MELILEIFSPITSTIKLSKYILLWPPDSRQHSRNLCPTFHVLSLEARAASSSRTLKADRLALPLAPIISAFVTLKTVEVNKKERIPTQIYDCVSHTFTGSVCCRCRVACMVVEEAVLSVSGNDAGGERSGVTETFGSMYEIQEQLAALTRKMGQVASRMAKSERQRAAEEAK